MTNLELKVFNVGQGLSVALIEHPEKYVTLIDLGASTGFTPLKHLSLKYQLRVDVLYVTHPHADHINDVETALESNFAPYGINYQSYDWADVKKREKPDLAYKVDLFQDLINAIPFKTYAGNASLIPWHFTPDNARKRFGENSYVNNSSFFVVYQWRDFKISIAGDLESDGMSDMVAAQNVRDSAKGTYILIPPHHGHKNGFPTDWVTRMGKPHVSIISVQERDQSVDSRYRSAGFARGVTFAGETRYALTTRADGSINVTMWYDDKDVANWSFSKI
jgi:beta-lactamase superfamily II metal-dependent hydrolase